MNRHRAPVSGSGRTVAYREFASGHDCRLQNPVRLYSFRQKFCSFVLSLREKFILVSLVVLSLVNRLQVENSLELERAELLVDDLPDYLVGRHLERGIRSLVQW